MIELSFENFILQVEVADTFLKKFFGLMGRKNLKQGHALLLTDCNSIHMCFMKFPIDVVFVDDDFKILKISRRLKTWTGISFCFKARHTLELPACDADRLNLTVGKNFFKL